MPLYPMSKLWHRAQGTLTGLAALYFHTLSLPVPYRKPNPNPNPNPKPQMLSLPPELLFDILVRLPPPDLIRCLCVSKAWNAFIRDQHFIKSHLQRSIKTNSARTILVRSSATSCLFLVPCEGNGRFGTAVSVELPLGDWARILAYPVHGVVCIPGDNEDTKYITLWNPSIQKFKKIPYPTFEQEPLPEGMRIEFKSVRYGFGYDSINDDYKLLQVMETGGRFMSVDSSVVYTQVKIYSLKSKSWKRIQNMPVKGFQLDTSHDVLFVNSALCLMMINRLDKCRYIIVTLDLATEEYRHFPTPFDTDANETSFGPYLGVLGGCLACLCICNFHSEPRIDVWIMKEFGVTKSWTMLHFILDEDLHCGLHRSRLLIGNFEMVLLRRLDNSDLFRFHLEKNIAEQVEIPGLPSHFESTFCVHGSLCLLDGDPVIVGR